MIKSKRLLNVWKQYLTTCIKYDMPLDEILDKFKDKVAEHLNSERDDRGWFLYNGNYCQIGWCIKKETKLDELNDKAIPIEICIFWDEQNGEEEKSIHINLLEFFEKTMLEDSITLIEKATFDII